MEKNKNIDKDELTGVEIISDHDYDGIKELNNPMPKWWLWLFYLSIVFAAVYMLRYFVLKTGDSQTSEYAKEMAFAAKYSKSSATKIIEERDIVLLSDQSSLEAGKVIFDKLCAVCHLTNGEGLVGPNLCDEYWIHGGSMIDIYKIIVDGNPSKGMISWKAQLTPEKIQEVASYIYILEGTNPPNQKAPEGKIYKR